MEAARFLLFLVMNIFLFTTANCDYFSDREKLVKSEQELRIGADLVLNEKEIEVNKILMNYKLQELNEGFLHPEKFLVAQHFFRAKAGIEKSPIFKFIKDLAKGSSLHSHDIAIASEEYVFSLTFKENLYICLDKKIGNVIFKFFKDPSSDKTCDWKLVSSLRKDNSTYDDFLKSQLTLTVKNPETIYPNINFVWKSAIKKFTTLESLICYKPVFQEYFYQVLKEHYEDNVMYVEFRGTLPPVYDLDESIYGPVDVVGLYVDTLKQFKHDYPDFYDARFIFAPSRYVKNITNYIKIFNKIKAAYPEFVVGFDLVGQEDIGMPLFNFINELLEMKGNTKFFFHAGETDWNGESTDFNLVDAVLLNSTRIGHGYALLKHPKVFDMIKEKNIAIEVNPIANQVSRLVDDNRNHPASSFIATNVPMVICCDDPSLWGTKALSYDWYVAFMAFSSKTDDLKLLKQLAINSIKYAAMDQEEKDKVLQIWQDKWDKFIDVTLNKYSFNYTNNTFVNKI